MYSENQKNEFALLRAEGESFNSLLAKNLISPLEHSLGGLRICPLLSAI